MIKLVKLLFAGALSLQIGTLSDTISAEPSPKEPGVHRLVLCNDGGTLVGPFQKAPIGVEGLIANTIGPLPKRDAVAACRFWSTRIPTTTAPSYAE